MRRILAGLCVAVYTVLALGANGAGANPIEDLREGAMKKLSLTTPAKPLPTAALVDMADTPVELTAYQNGRWMVLNFWAAWCAPCREEMPSLDALSLEMPEIAVVPVATGRNQPAALERFYKDAGIQHLPLIRDPSSELSRAMGVLALPVTVIVNPEGAEVARLIGEADWNAENAKLVLRALMDAP